MNARLVFAVSLVLAAALTIVPALLFAMRMDWPINGVDTALVICLAAGTALLVAMTIWRLTTPSSTDGGLLPRSRLVVGRLEIVALLAALPTLAFAIWSIQQAAEQSRLAQEALQDQRISSAWQILAQRASGSAGKGYALQILANETEEELYGLTLGCTDPDFGTPGSTGTLTCQVPLRLSGLHLERETGDRIPISSSDLRFVQISDSTIIGAQLEGIEIQGAILQNILFEETWFTGVAFGNRPVRGSVIAPIPEGLMDLAAAAVPYDSWLQNVRFEHSVLQDVTVPTGQDSWTARSNAIFNRSVLLDVAFTNQRPIQTNQLSLQLPGLAFTQSDLYEIDFSDITFAPRFQLFGCRSIQPEGCLIPSITFSGVSYGRGRLRDDEMPDIRAANPVQIEISDAVFCEQHPLETTEYVCWQDASQEFFDHAWFEAGHPPVGLEHLPFEVSLRPGCPWRQSLTPEQRPPEHYKSRIVERDCMSVDPIPLSAIDFEAPASDYYIWAR